MKKAITLFIMLCTAVMLSTGLAYAQDVLGAHNVNGHGCASCHAPHSGAAGNGGTDTSTGVVALWGRAFIGKTYTTPVGSFTTPATLAGFVAADADPMFKTAACLSCHDGSATVVGMHGTSVETVDGTNYAPTYLAKDAEGLTNDHPVHTPYTPDATTSGYGWQGTVDATTGKIYWGGDAAQAAFVQNYGRTASFYGAAVGATTGASGAANTAAGAYVECTSCHNQHSMTAYQMKVGQTWTTVGASCPTAQFTAEGGCYIGGTTQVKPSRFFIKGWFDSLNPASNSAAQFCRQCHGGESNEKNGVFNVPTT